MIKLKKQLKIINLLQSLYLADQRIPRDRELGHFQLDLQLSVLCPNLRENSFSGSLKLLLVLFRHSTSL